MISRRVFLASAASFALAPQFAFAKDGVPTVLDHILLGCNDLDRGIAYVEKHTGVPAMFGGVHPGRGTRNALLSLGEPARDELHSRRYLEIIAPDPQQTGVSDHYGLEKLTEPRLVGWAAHPGDLNQFAIRLRNAGVEFDGPTPGSRQTPDGKLLQWKTLNLKDAGLLPFFIEWNASSTHPSIAAPRGCHLDQFELLTPDPEALTKTAKRLGLDVEISKADRPQLRAVIKGGDQVWQVTS
ncbi:MAG TPA: VOC family protein [Candidatus Acidoferrum sp.]|nr:VOC family protein [Candidatus Acidoferrum sp.]